MIGQHHFLTVCVLGKDPLVPITYLGGCVPTQSLDIVLYNMKGKLALCML
jgi:hypothetical protein